MHRIIISDGYTLNPGDLSWCDIESLGELVFYDRSSSKEFLQRAKNATILVANKQIVTSKELSQLKHLQCICLSATGYNNIDIKACAKRGIPVCNVVGYGSTSVAQHVFALLLSLTNHVSYHSKGVHKGQWSNAVDWSYWDKPLFELAGKTIGIYGFGKIGRQVSRIALGFGMKVIATHKHPERDAMPGVSFVEFETLCTQSDVITLHAPLSKANENIINSHSIGLMKRSAFLINTGRGGLVNEDDLKLALNKGTIAGAGLDVLTSEPPPSDHPLIGVPNLFITPHHAWATRDSRKRLLNEVVKNVKAFIAGRPTNVVNPEYINHL